MGRYKLLITLLLFVSLLLLALYLQREYGGASSIPEEHRNFSIEDTGKVERIFIADQDDRTILLEKGRKEWTVNDSFRAQEHKVEMILGTFHDMRMKKPVSDASMETVLKNMSALNKKVEVYMEGDDEPFRTYYLGTNTSRHDATYMLLETPELGKAERPYVVHIPSQQGFLNPRFFTNIDEWRHTGVFNYEIPNVRRVELENFQNPQQSFYLENGPEGVSLYRMFDDQQVQRFDSVRVKDYLLNFRKAHVETYATGLSEEERDSILRSGPIYTLRVIDAAGDTNELEAYLKSKPENPLSKTDSDYDLDRMFARTDDGEMAIIQRYVFGRFFQTLSELQKDYSGKERNYRNLGPDPPEGYTPTSGQGKQPPQGPS